MADLKDRIIGGFRVLKEIQAGSGSQGTVYKAVCVEDKHGLVSVGTVVALKVMVVQDEERIQWGKLEKRTRELSQLDHPCVVRYYGCFSESGLYNDVHVVVQEFLDGETLKERLVRFPTGLDVDEGLKVADAALSGLVYTSRRGIIHRDVKPGNIFLCSDGSVKLIDFEIARQDGGTTTSTAGNLRGSFDYMAPDFTNAEFHGDVQSDVFSMGVVLHEILTGKTPYQRLEGGDKQANFAFLSRWAHTLADGYNPIRVSSRINRLLAHADDVMARSLAPRREDRYADFEAFRDGLKAIRFRTLRHGQVSYQMLQFIGKGGFGEVFKARSRQTGKTVAVKHLLKASYAERFFREAKIMKKLHDPCFVQFVDFFTMDAGNSSEAFLVMAFLDGMPGSSLRDAIRGSENARLPREDVFRAFERYAQGLSAMHAEGIFHRDIKPSNLYFPNGNPGAAAIMDLGIARDVNGTATHGQVPGTLDYMPPEVVITDNRGDGGMDIYALGLCFYEALTAKTAYPRLPTGTAAYTAFFDRAKSKRKPVFDDPDVQDDKELLALLSDMTNPELSQRIREAREVVSRIRGMRDARFSVCIDDRETIAPGEETSALSGAEGEESPETVAGDVPTQGTVVSPMGETQRAALQLERERIRAERRRRRSVATGVLLAVGILVILGGAGSLAWKPVLNRLSESEMNGILEDYRRGRLDEARRKESEWRTRWNPDARTWWTLDATAFSNGIARVSAVKAQVEDLRKNEARKEAVERDRQGALAKMSACLDGGGRMDEGAFARLDGWTPPDAFLSDESSVREMRAKLERMRVPLVSAIKGKLSVEPVQDRRKRIRQADSLMGNSWTAKILSREDQDALASEVRSAALWSVGVVTNGCDFDIQLDGQTIAASGAKVAVYRDGHPERGTITCKGYHDVSLPADFDGRVFAVNERTFVATPENVVFPNVTAGVTCRFQGRTVSAGDVVSLMPGDYDCTYSKGGDYEDQTVSFSVRTNVKTVIPGPGQTWKPSDEAMRKKKERDEQEKLRRAAVERDRARQREERKQEIEGACTKRLANEPIEDRQRRLAEALELLDKAENLDRVMTASESGPLRAEVERRKRWVVGKVRNGCKGQLVTIGGRKVGPGKTELFVFKDGLPEDWSCDVPGYEKKELSREFDGRTLEIGEDDLEAESVVVSLPKLDKDVTCHFEGSVVKSALSLKPGRYICTYRREGYGDQEVSFVVSLGKSSMIPAPDEWTAKPVKVVVPELDPGVTCLVDGDIVRSSALLPPGSHVCEYRRADHMMQRSSFVVQPATPMALPALGVWKPSSGLKWLNDAELLAQDGKWHDVAMALDKADVISDENRRRKETLRARINEQAEREKKQSELKDIVEAANVYYNDTLYYTAVESYFRAHELGYALTREDRECVAVACEKAKADLLAKKKRTEDGLMIGRSPLFNLDEIEAKLKNLTDWSKALK